MLFKKLIWRFLRRRRCADCRRFRKGSYDGHDDGRMRRLKAAFAQTKGNRIDLEVCSKDLEGSVDSRSTERRRDQNKSGAFDSIGHCISILGTDKPADLKQSQEINELLKCIYQPADYRSES